MPTTFEDIRQAIASKCFAPPKPKADQNDADKKLIAGLESRGNLMIQRKHDGHGHLVTIGDKSADVELYTLGLNPATPKYPHLVEQINAVAFPPRTLIGSELTCTVAGRHDRYAMGALTTSTPENARATQKSSGLYPEMSIFSALIWDGEDVSKWSNHDRYACVLEHLKKIKRKAGDANHIGMTELLEVSLADARESAKVNRWEGLVLYDKNGNTQFKVGKGGKKPSNPRPVGIWKDKAYVEVDFVAYGFAVSDADAHVGGVKDFQLGLICPKTGKIIPCGNCGGGLTTDDRFKYAKPGALPIAVEVVFEQWSKNGKVIQGSIARFREPSDKHYSECIASDEQLQNGLSAERLEPTWK